ncbi:Kinetochore protein Spc24 [Dispira simplex]|nr:Kinetochore protein Spc24 [Dispira simplex]
MEDTDEVRVHQLDLNLDEEDTVFTINQKYAENYKNRKRAEEITALKEKYGNLKEFEAERLEKMRQRMLKYGYKVDDPRLLESDSSDSENSESEEEDEDGELATPEIHVQVLKTLGAIRQRDQRIYDTQSEFFIEDQMNEARTKWEQKQKALKESEKPLYLADQQRQTLLEKGPEFDEEEADAELTEKAKESLTHVEEQEKLKKDIRKAFHEAISDGEDDGLLVARVKSKEEKAKEEEEYRNFLLESLSHDQSAAEAFKAWNGVDDAKGITGEDKFLLDYIVNRGWMNKNKEDDAPDYDEIVGEREDEDEVELQEEFEDMYNLRFEEENANTAYSREVLDSVRRKDNRRKLARQRLAERKAREKEERAEELKRLKNAKKMEIVGRLKAIQKATGNRALDFEDVDLDEDFDPAKFDEKMNNIFDDKFYDPQGEALTKPVFPDDIDLDDLIPQEEEDKPRKTGKKQKAKDKQPSVDDDDFIMDADFLPGGEHYEGPDEEEAGSSSQKGNKHRKLNELLDEVYQLDYEDMIGDLPTRFRYRQVEKASYGLSPAEILLADDRDLNQHVGLSKLATYRPRDVEQRELPRLASRARVCKFRQGLNQTLKGITKLEGVQFSVVDGHIRKKNSHQANNQGSHYTYKSLSR